MAKAKILPVCKDIGAANVVGPIVRELLGMQAGHEIIPVIEGLGGKQWLELWGRPVFQGTEDYKTMPFSLDVEAVINHYRPDVIILGESSPNNLEEEFAWAAQQYDIPLVLVEDFWGGFVRITGLTKSPELILTLDDYAVQLAKEEFSDSHIIVTGNPGVRRSVTDPAAQVMDLRRQGDFVVTLCGGGPETAEQIELLLKCLSMTSADWRLIPRWHPKEANRPDPENRNRPYHEIWDALLAPFGERVVRVGGPPDNVVVASNLVCSGYSTLLTTTVQAGVVAVSLVTPQVQQNLEAESAAREMPHVALGVAHRVDTPLDLAQLQPCSEGARARLKPFDPAVGAAAIEALLEGC